MNNKLIGALSIALLLSVSKIQAQLSVSAQLRARSEFRDGQGAPLSEGQKPAFFTSQRSRLNLLFNSYRLKLGLSIQDVRVWGQDVSMINRTTTADNNGFMLHEAWAELLLTDTAVQKKLMLKIGRQELIYDDQRLLGNLDWLQQARRHDAALLKYEQGSWMLHLGLAYNQNKEKASGTEYNNVPPGNYPASTNGGAMYKSMEFFYAAKKIAKGNLSLLFFSDQFNSYTLDSINNKTFTSGAWTRATTGLYYIQKHGNIDLSASAYYQFGKNAKGENIGGQLLSASAMYAGKISAGGGIDYTSPDFDPLYGTPHKFWGLMDYYYAGSPFGKHGLVDYYLKSKAKPTDKLSLMMDVHHFTAASSVDGYEKNFGDEIDAVATYQFSRQTSFEIGYSHYFSTPTLTSPTVKNVPNARSNANWAYIMINIKPEFLFK